MMRDDEKRAACPHEDTAECQADGENCPPGSECCGLSGDCTIPAPVPVPDGGGEPVNLDGLLEAIKHVDPQDVFETMSLIVRNLERDNATLCARLAETEGGGGGKHHPTERDIIEAPLRVHIAALRARLAETERELEQANERVRELVERVSNRDRIIDQVYETLRRKETDIDRMTPVYDLAIRVANECPLLVLGAVCQHNDDEGCEVACLAMDLRKLAKKEKQ